MVQARAPSIGVMSSLRSLPYRHRPASRRSESRGPSPASLTSLFCSMASASATAWLCGTDTSKPSSPVYPQRVTSTSTRPAPVCAVVGTPLMNPTLLRSACTIRVSAAAAAGPAQRQRERERESSERNVSARGCGSLTVAKGCADLAGRAGTAPRALRGSRRLGSCPGGAAGAPGPCPRTPRSRQCKGGPRTWTVRTKGHARGG
jgi:hypothetical protein